MTRLSEHFTVEEFGLQDAPRIACFLYKRLADDILEPIRAFLDCPIRVTSGWRTPDDAARLAAAGYHPSETSDHFGGSPVAVRDAAKIQIYGRWFWASTGAADLVPALPGGAEKAFNLLLARARRPHPVLDLGALGTIQVGQMIFERNDHGSAWIHVSNPRGVIVAPELAEKCFPRRQPFLVSTANGKPGYYREP